jgi:hypothetical protein
MAANWTCSLNLTIPVSDPDSHPFLSQTNLLESTTYMGADVYKGYLIYHLSSSPHRLISPLLSSSLLASAVDSPSRVSRRLLDARYDH